MTVSHPTFEVETHPMEVKQIYTGCLAQGAYYIESNGEAAIVDPLREVQPYLDLAKDRGATIDIDTSSRNGHEVLIRTGSLVDNRKEHPSTSMRLRARLPMSMVTPPCYQTVQKY